MTDDHCITFLKKLTGIDVDLANPLPVLKWMREHMEVRLESYINWCDSDHKRRINVFFDVLDL